MRTRQAQEPDEETSVQETIDRLVSRRVGLCPEENQSASRELAGRDPRRLERKAQPVSKAGKALSGAVRLGSLPLFI